MMRRKRCKFKGGGNSSLFFNKIAGYNLQNGFTLIEVVITIAILSILVAISFIIYRHYFHSAFEVDPVSVLFSAQVAQEMYYADHGKYASSIEELSGFSDGSDGKKYYLNQDKDPRRRFYITISSSSNDSYTLIVKNETNDPEWEIEWKLSCGINYSIGSCKPQQVKGSSLLEKIF